MSESLLFVDTGYLVALLNKRDRLHGQASKLARTLAKTRRRLLTTDGVLIELANFFAGSELRTLAISSIRRIRSNSGWLVERLEEKLIERAEARYASHPDKAWSLTDCASMEVMLDKACSEAATPDKHFAQAGFRVLMTVRA